MNSIAIKGALMWYWRFKRQKVVIDELNGMDIAVYDKTNLMDIEIKISKADLRADKKKHKHKRYLTGPIHEFDRYRLNPTHFYFCVPPDLKEAALEEIRIINPKYGLIISNGNCWTTSVAKSAKRLWVSKHTPTPYCPDKTENILWDIAMRCGAKLCSMYEKQGGKTI